MNLRCLFGHKWKLTAIPVNFAERDLGCALGRACSRCGTKDYKSFRDGLAEMIHAAIGPTMMLSTNYQCPACGHKPTCKINSGPWAAATALEFLEKMKEEGR